MKCAADWDSLLLLCVTYFCVCINLTSFSWHKLPNGKLLFPTAGVAALSSLDSLCCDLCFFYCVLNNMLHSLILDLNILFQMIW